VHALLQHRWSTQPSRPLTLTARARQFSSFVLLIGTIAAADAFEPRHAIIVCNKDELLIPLLLTPLPTPKEFKDAIASLSPEQARFARAFRAMQLESTLFALLVVQIKPQLEQLLNLPDDALTKEIKLTDSLMNLFLEFNVPSDLLSFNAENDADEADADSDSADDDDSHVSGSGSGSASGDNGSTDGLALRRVKEHVHGAFTTRHVSRTFANPLLQQL